MGWQLFAMSAKRLATYRIGKPLVGFTVHKDFIAGRGLTTAKRLPQGQSARNATAGIQALIAVGDGMAMTKALGLETELVALTTPIT